MLVHSSCILAIILFLSRSSHDLWYWIRKRYFSFRSSIIFFLSKLLIHRKTGLVICLTLFFNVGNNFTCNRFYLLFHIITFSLLIFISFIVYVHYVVDFTNWLVLLRLDVRNFPSCKSCLTAFSWLLLGFLGYLAQEITVLVRHSLLKITVIHVSQFKPSDMSG